MLQVTRRDIQQFTFHNFVCIWVLKTLRWNKREENIIVADMKSEASNRGVQVAVSLYVYMYIIMYIYS